MKRWPIYFSLLCAVVSVRVLGSTAECGLAWQWLTESSGASVFRLEEITRFDIKRLSSMGTYKVPLRNGTFGVLKVDWKEPFPNSVPSANSHDLHFEVFSHAVFRLMGKPLPIPTWLIPPRKLLALLAEIEQSQTKTGNTPIAMSLRTGTVDRAILIPFFSGSTGRQYLYETTGMAFRSTLHRLVHFLIMSANNQTTISGAEFRRALASDWNSLTEIAKASIVHDLERLFPNQTFSQDSIFETLYESLEGPLWERLADIVLLAFQHLPHETQVELAEIWAIYTVLGIPDFHPSNWIINGRIIPIDLAYRSAHFAYGGPEILFGLQQNPLDGDLLSPKYAVMFGELFSPHFLAILRNLSIDSLLEVARATRMHLTWKQANAMVERARGLVRLGLDGTPEAQRSQ